MGGSTPKPTSKKPCSRKEFNPDREGSNVSEGWGLSVCEAIGVTVDNGMVSVKVGIAVFVGVGVKVNVGGGVAVIVGVAVRCGMGMGVSVRSSGSSPTEMAGTP
jgi:hypothetical protein